MTVVRYGIALYELAGALPPANFHWAIVTTTSTDYTVDVHKMSIVNHRGSATIPWEFHYRLFKSMYSQTLVGIVEVFTSASFPIDDVVAWIREQSVAQDDYTRFGSRWSCAFWSIRVLEQLMDLCGCDQRIEDDVYLRVVALGERLKIVRNAQAVQPGGLQSYSTLPLFR